MLTKFYSKDHSIASDSDVRNFVVGGSLHDCSRICTNVVSIDELTPRVERGETLYVHCRGGHGRTGTIVALLLCKQNDS